MLMRTHYRLSIFAKRWEQFFHCWRQWTKQANSRDIFLDSEDDEVMIPCFLANQISCEIFFKCDFHKFCKAWDVCILLTTLILVLSGYAYGICPMKMSVHESVTFLNSSSVKTVLNLFLFSSSCIPGFVRGSMSSNLS